MTDKAKVFRSGRSQFVRLPERYRLDVDEVRVRRQGAALVLEPVANDWDWLEDVMGDLDPEFAAAALEPVDERHLPDLDEPGRGEDKRRSIVDLLGMAGDEDIEFDPPRLDLGPRRADPV